MEMLKIIQVRQFVWKSEIGRGWIYPTLEEAEKELGWFFLHNFCEYK
jgi:hypothetical protein